MAQPATATDLLDPTLVARAQRYEREAVTELFGRNLGLLHRMCLALTGDPAAAESLAAAAMLKALDGLPGFEGDGPAFDVWLARLVAAAAARRRSGGTGLRAALARVSNFDFELIALRVLAGVDVDHLAPALNAQPAALRAWFVSALRETDGRSGTGWGPDLRAFDAAVDDVLKGADPAQAGARVSAPGDAGALLGTVAGVRALAGDPIPAAAATRLRTIVLAGAAERRALWVHRHHAAATVPGIERRHYGSRRGTVLAMAVAGVLALMVGAVLSVLSSFAGPDSAFYPLKRAGEAALVAIDLDSVDRAQLEVKLAQTRQREAEDMAARGLGDRAVAAQSDRYDLLRAASQDLLSAAPRNARWTSARSQLFAESGRASTLVERDLEATGQAQAARDAQRLATTYERDRRSLEAELGRTGPSPAPQAPAGGTPPPA